MITPQQALNRLIDQNELFHDEMMDLMRQIMSGQVPPEVIAALLVGLRIKVETVSEVAAAAKIMREFATQVPVRDNTHLVDIVGTGGDNAHIYSLSTLLLHIVLPHRPVQEAMAAAYRRLGDYMLEKAQFFDPDEADYLHSKEVSLALKNSHVVNAFNACRSALFYRLRSQHRHPRTVRMLQYYLAAQNMHERISSRHVEYRDFAHHLEHSDLIYRIQRLIVLQAHSCYALSNTVLADGDFVCDNILKRAHNNSILIKFIPIIVIF